MSLTFFKRTSKVEDSIFGLNDLWLSETRNLFDKNTTQVHALEQRIIKMRNDIQKIHKKKEMEKEVKFKKLAKKIGHLLSIISNTNARFIFGPPGGLGFSLEVNKKQKYRVYLFQGVGIGLHTWKYKMLDDDGNTPEYNRIEPVLALVNDSYLHDFSDYNSNEKIIDFLESNCKVNASG